MPRLVIVTFINLSTEENRIRLCVTIILFVHTILKIAEVKMPSYVVILLAIVACYIMLYLFNLKVKVCISICYFIEITVRPTYRWSYFIIDCANLATDEKISAELHIYFCTYKHGTPT